MKWAFIGALGALLSVGCILYINTLGAQSLPGSRAISESEEAPAPTQIVDAITPGCFGGAQDMPAGLKDLRGLSIRVFDSRGWSTTLLEAFLDT
jgi:hypothetical protein